MRPRRLLPLLLAVLALGVAACSEESSEEAAKGEDTKADLREETTAPPETSGAQRAKPKVAIPEGDPPKELRTRDLIRGEGATAKNGSNVSINYVGVAYSNGREFDTSFGKSPLDFALGGGQVIPGFDRGIQGMKVGGRRRITIPPDLAYGRAGQPPVIGKNETLVFVVDLLSAQ